MQRGRQEETPTQFGPLDRTEFVASDPCTRDAMTVASNIVEVAVLQRSFILSR